MAAKETGWFKSDSGIVWELDLPLNPMFQNQADKGLLTRCTKDGEPYAEPEPESKESKPVKGKK